MEPETFFAYLQRQIVSRKVTFRRLATNSLILYIECEPGGNESGYIIWFKPTWHFVGPERVLTGSRQAQEGDEYEEDADAGFRAAGEAMNAVLDRTVEAITIEPITWSLIVSLSGGYTVRTFVSDPTDDDCWSVKENATPQRLVGSPQGLEFVQGASEPSLAADPPQAP